MILRSVYSDGRVDGQLMSDPGCHLEVRRQRAIGLTWRVTSAQRTPDGDTLGLDLFSAEA